MIQIEPETEPEKRAGMHQNIDLLGGPKASKTIVSLCFRMKWSPEGGPKMEQEMNPKWSQNGVKLGRFKT